MSRQHYYLGRSRYNNSIYGWGGHTPHGQPLYQDAGGENKTERYLDAIIEIQICKKIESFTNLNKKMMNSS